MLLISWCVTTHCSAVKTVHCNHTSNRSALICEQNRWQQALLKFGDLKRNYFQKWFDISLEIYLFFCLWHFPVMHAFITWCPNCPVKPVCNHNILLSHYSQHNNILCLSNSNWCCCNICIIIHKSFDCDQFIPFSILANSSLCSIIRRSWVILQEL